MSSHNAALLMTDAEWEDRLKRSRQALRCWSWELKLPWVDRDMTRTIAETELAYLRYAVPLLPDGLQADIAALIHDWDELGLALL